MKEAVLNTHHPESQGAPSDSVVKMALLTTPFLNVSFIFSATS